LRLEISVPCRGPTLKVENSAFMGGGDRCMAHRGCLHCRVLMRLWSLQGWGLHRAPGTVQWIILQVGWTGVSAKVAYQMTL
jgi:hypothetical protein